MREGENVDKLEQVIKDVELGLRIAKGTDCGLFKTSVKSAEQILELLKEQQPKKGHWEKSEYADDRWHKCSECGKITERIDKNGYKLVCNFCRICGADMRGEKNKSS